jgi:DNA-directed RNA polymerase specialized sigma24 family protein
MSTVTSTEKDNLSIDPDRDFDRFLRLTEPRLRLALMSTYGFEEGREATAEALAWAWEHRDRLVEINYPVRYLYRVGQSRVRRRKLRLPFARTVWAEPRIEPELMGALRQLSERQRVAVVLVHGYAWTLAEVAELLELKVPTVQTHLERGLSRLRSLLEVTPDA